jgi:RNA polymerase sigma factor (sigma-70 family)
MTQDAFVRAWQKLSTFHGRSSFSTWLHRVAVNVILGKLRSESRSADRETAVEDLESLAGAQPSNRPDIGIDLENAITLLPARARTVFVLHDVEGYRRNCRADRDCRRNLEGSSSSSSKTIERGAQRMNCDSFADHVDDYVDGTLERNLVASIERHLATCTSCRSNLDELRSLMKAASDLPGGIDPGRNLWPQIADRIDSSVIDWSGRRSTPPQTLRWLQMAAVIGLMVFGLWVARSQIHQGPSRPAARLDASGQSARQSLADYADRAHTEDGIMLAKKDLLSTIEQRRDVLDDHTLQQIEADMLVLDEAIGQIRAALVEQPENRRLKLALAARYQQEVRLLQQVSRV